MFKDLRLAAIEGGRGINRYFPIGVDAIVAGSERLDYLYAEDLKEWSEGQFYGVDGHINFSSMTKIGEVKSHFMARVTAYIITVCTLDGVLCESYRNFICRLCKLGYKTPICDDNVLLSKCRDEIKDYRIYRDKVFAHTSFAYPRGDPIYLQQISLDYLTGYPLRMTEKGLYLSGAKGKIDMFKEVGIIGGHDAIKNHYLTWEGMFVSILEGIDKGELSSKLSIA